MEFWEHPVTVRVPATSANLGPGFDSLGLALQVYDELTVSASGGELSIVVEGEGADDVPRDASHLVVRSMRRAFAAMDIPAPGLLLSCVNRIPHSRGMGSSSAAIVGGLWAARAMVVDGDERLSDEQLLQLATEIEGHPDNVAPCLFGGFTIAWTDGTGTHSVSRSVVAGVDAMVFVPPNGVATKAARGLLPEQVPHQDAVFNAARTALLVDALVVDDGRAIEQRLEQLLAATDDRLHQPHRATAMPDSAALVAALRAAGIPAAISGAGPTVLAFTSSATQATAQQVAASFPGFSVRPAAIDPAGACITVG